jgi:hypothetical protein
MSNSILERISGWKQKVSNVYQEYNEVQAEYVDLFAVEEKTTTTTTTTNNNNNNNNNKSSMTTTKTTTTVTTIDCNADHSNNNSLLEIESLEAKLFATYKIIQFTYEKYYIGCIQRQIPIMNFCMYNTITGRQQQQCGTTTTTHNNGRRQSQSQFQSQLSRAYLRNQFKKQFQIIAIGSKEFLISSKKEIYFDAYNVVVIVITMLL